MKPQLRQVRPILPSTDGHRDAVDADIDGADAALAKAVEDHLAADSAVSQMIATTTASLSAMMDTCRKLQASRETEKAGAHADYEKSVVAARLLRDQRLADLDAELHQINVTMEAIEPARAKLAERS